MTDLEKILDRLKGTREIENLTTEELQDLQGKIKAELHKRLGCTVGGSMKVIGYIGNAECHIHPELAAQIIQQCRIIEPIELNKEDLPTLMDSSKGIKIEPIPVVDYFPEKGSKYHK